MQQQTIQLSDLQRLFASESPDLPALLEAFFEQGDPDLFEIEPDPNAPVGDDGEPPEPARRDPPEGWISADELRSTLARAGRQRTREKRRKAALEAWQKFLAQDPALLPPRFALGDLVEQLYQRDTASARALLLSLAHEAPLRFGLWRGLKNIYKQAEKRMDAAVIGALAARFDRETNARAYNRDVSQNTLAYLRRRAWRFLRQLGQAVPELYPQFAVEVLRHYPSDTGFSSLWVANHIFAHNSKKYTSRSFEGRFPPDDMVKNRAFTDAWKRAPEALMYLLETCLSDAAASFAIQGLQKDFPERLRKATPEWLARLAFRPLESAHEFLVETLQGSPDFHQAKLRSLGLHDAVVQLLRSPSKKARTYAVEYTRAQGRDLPKELLAELLEADAHKEVTEMAKALLTARPPRELGHAFLGKLLAISSVNEWAAKALNESFERKEIPLEFLVEMLFGDSDQADWFKDYVEAKYPGVELGAKFWTGVLDDKRAEDDRNARGIVFKFLKKYKAADIGADWLITGLTRTSINDEVAAILKKADKLPGLDAERVKGLVFNPAYRKAALEVLGNHKLLGPNDLGLPWLLALAKRGDPELHEFAHRYLLEHLKPADFADGDAKAGVERLFGLALGEREPEPVRVFAQTYLRCHHPELGPEQDESKQLSLKPYLKESDYDPERLWAALFDGRSDVRRFALTLVKPHLRKWKLHTRVYELAESDAKEIRNLAYDALRGAGDEGADPAVALKPEELDAARIFQLTESTKRSTRDVGMELIRRHYGRLGGAERLAWLMQSADREVRLFAVRLLWEKHRPRAYPPGWKPRKKAEVPLDDVGRFEDVEALRGLLRRLLFGLPPGRAPVGDEGERRRVSASVVKRNVVDLVRDLGVQDAAFAALVAPVLQEFTGSLARGEWQACLSALAHLQGAHPELEVLRALWRNTTRVVSRKSGRWRPGLGCW